MTLNSVGAGRAERFEIQKAGSNPAESNLVKHTAAALPGVVLEMATSSGSSRLAAAGGFKSNSGLEIR